MPVRLRDPRRFLASGEREEEAAPAAAAPAAAAAPTASLTPEQEAQFTSWMQQIQNAGGAQAMFSGDNIRGAEQTAIQNRQASDAAAAAQAAEEARVNAVDQRFGTDLSWLDPTFQRQAATVNQSAGASAYADPAAVAQQTGAMNRASQMANQNLAFQSPAQQQAMMAQWAGIQGGQGAPSFRGDADQRAVLNQAMGFGSNTGPGSLQFDNGARQSEQYGNLQGIIAGGGATAIEMADRARQRGDSEAWLRGQREADMADYAERGLTGSGMELLALSSDRQAAAGRNSLADLETAKALEQRRMDAINSAAGLASTMRGNTIDEQSLLNNRSTAGLNAASSVANAMRTADYNERTYLDERTLDALRNQTDLTTTMRDQTRDEQIANSNAQQNALNTWANTSSNARTSSAQESQYRATAEDDRMRDNQSAINQASQDNQRALTDGYQTMMQNRQQWQQLMAQLGVRSAEGLMDHDQKDNVVGSQLGTQVGIANSNQANNAKSDYRDALLGAYGVGQAGVNQTNRETNALAPQLGAWGGQAVDVIGQVMTGGAGGAGAGGGSLSQPNTTWAQSAGSASPGQTSTSTQGWNIEDEDTWNMNK
jgi:hypothetical protein